MQQPFMSVGTLTEPQPWDPADPATPAVKGWHSQDPLSPSELRPELVNDVAGEIIRLGITGGLFGPHRDELRQIFRGDDMPDIAALPMVDQIAEADMVSQSGYYKRVGFWVDIQFRAEWGNTDGGLDAEPLQFHLPYQAAQIAVGQLSQTQSNLRNSNPAPATIQHHEMAIVSPPAQYVGLWTTAGLGQAVNQEIIGNAGTDGGHRFVLANIRYKTTGLRNTAWPYIEWYSITHTPISPGPTILEYRYDGALNGDLVELLTFPGLVLVDSHNLTVPPPSGRGSFTVLAAGQYVLRLRSKFVSRTALTVSAS